MKINSASRLLRLIAVAFLIFNSSALRAADTTKPTAPTGLSAIAVSARQVNLNWTASTDNVGVTAYLIETCQGKNCTQFFEIGSSTGPSFTDADTAPSTIYRYRVRATDAAGNLSSYSNIASVTTPGVPPAPTGLTATVVGLTRVDLQWAASKGAVNYRVSRAPGQGFSCSQLPGFAQIGTTAGTTFSDTTIAPDGMYCYYVIAVDSAGNTSDPSWFANVKVDQVAPTTPGALSVNSVTASSVGLTWTASTDNVSVSRYEVRRCLSPCTINTYDLVGQPTANAFNDTTVAAATGYLYKVDAVDTSGNSSADSNVVSATTPPPGAVSTLTPTALNLNVGASGTLTATFTSPPTAAGTISIANSNSAVATVPATVSFVAGQATVAIPVSAVAAGTATVTASANGGQANATVNVNALPTVAITSPTDGAVLQGPATVTLTATAADPDGTVARVEFLDGSTLVGTTPNPPYSVTLSGVATGNHSYTARATDNAGASSTSSAVNITIDAAPSVAITAPANGTTFVAPANIPISASVSDVVGAITKVEFFQGGTLITAVIAPPYSFTWSNVPAGSYSVTAVATNDAGQTTTSAVVALTVSQAVAQAQIYYIYPDHLDTPRLIADASGTPVWRWDNTEPFGDSVPDSNPSNIGPFEFAFRFPGQYADSDTGLAYNASRDYDRRTGRYVESDPIGLLGGLDTYAYVSGYPLGFFDVDGLFCMSHNEIKLLAATAGGATTGGFLGGWGGAFVGGTVGFAAEFATQQAGLSESAPGLSAVGAAAGFVVSKGWRGKAVGALAGTLGGFAQSQSGGEFQNTIAGAAGGGLGTFAAEQLIASKPYAWNGTPLFSALKGGAAGILGGLVQDALEAGLKQFECPEDSRCAR